MALTDDEQQTKLEAYVSDMDRQGPSPAEERLAASIAAMGLGRYASELDEHGLTVLPPEVTGVTAEQCDRMAGRLLARAEELVGCPFTLEQGPLGDLEYSNPNILGLISMRKGDPPPPKLHQLQLVQLSQLDRAFRDLAVHPVAVALLRHMMGGPNDMRLSSMNSFIKWRGGDYGRNLGMHCDQTTPLPWGPQALNANVNWLLTDYTREGGAFAYVPGSHHRRSHPTFPAAVAEAVHVEAPRGSAIVFHGQLWHGAFPKSTGGLRVTVSNYYRHWSVSPQEDIVNSLPRELALDSGDPELFTRLVGYEGAPYRSQPAGLLVRAAGPRPGRDEGPTSRL